MTLEIRNKAGLLVGKFKGSMAKKYLNLLADSTEQFECKRIKLTHNGNTENHLIYEVIQFSMMFIGEFELWFEPKDYIKVLP